MFCMKLNFPHKSHRHLFCGVIKWAANIQQAHSTGKPGELFSSSPKVVSSYIIPAGSIFDWDHSRGMVEKHSTATIKIKFQYVPKTSWKIIKIRIYFSWDRMKFRHIIETGRQNLQSSHNVKVNNGILHFSWLSSTDIPAAKTSNNTTLHLSIWKCDPLSSMELIPRYIGFSQIHLYWHAILVCYLFRVQS